MCILLSFMSQLDLPYRKTKLIFSPTLISCNRVRREMRADAGCVNLRECSHFYYELGLNLHKLWVPDPTGSTSGKRVTTHNLFYVCVQAGSRQNSNQQPPVCQWICRPSLIIWRVQICRPASSDYSGLADLADYSAGLILIWASAFQSFLFARRNVDKGLGAWLKLAFDERFKGILHRSHTYSDKTVKDLERILSREEIQCEQIPLLVLDSKHDTDPFEILFSSFGIHKS